MLIRTREEFESARTVLLDADIIVLDTETNWTEHMHNKRMMGFSALAPR